MDHVLTPFWNKAVTFLPMWMAPNLVTLIGTILTLITSAPYMTMDGLGMHSKMPNINIWATIFAAFTYQTLDAIDGK